MPRAKSVKQAKKTVKQTQVPPRSYELTLVLSPAVAAEKRKDVVSALTKLIEKEQGGVEGIEEWGLKDLAYPIEKVHSGWYATLVVSLLPGSVARVESQLLQERKILRHVLIRRS